MTKPERLIVEWELNIFEEYHTFIDIANKPYLAEGIGVYIVFSKNGIVLKVGQSKVHVGNRISQQEEFFDSDVTWAIVDKESVDGVEKFLHDYYHLGLRGLKTPGTEPIPVNVPVSPFLLIGWNHMVIQAYSNDF